MRLSASLVRPFELEPCSGEPRDRVLLESAGPLWSAAVRHVSRPGHQDLGSTEAHSADAQPTLTTAAAPNGLPASVAESSRSQGETQDWLGS
jgi:hypothetical protein